MEQRKEKKVTYERLSDHEAAVALLIAIWKLRPQKDSYRAANYILGYRMYQSPKEVRFSLTDDKKRPLATAIIFYDEFTTSVQISIEGQDEIEPRDRCYKRVKGALRQMLPAIVFQDYTESRAPKQRLVSLQADFIG